MKKALLIVMIVCGIAEAGTHIMVGDVLPGGATSYIQNGSTLQSGSVFYVSSGTISQSLDVGDNSNTAVLEMMNGSSMTATSSANGFYFYTPNNNNWVFTGKTDATARQKAILTPTSLAFTDVIFGPSANFLLSANGATWLNFNSDAQSCSDGSTACQSKAVTVNGASGAIFDSTGKMNSGIKHKSALLAIGGQAIIGTGFSDIGPMQTNGLLVSGPVNVGSSSPSTVTSEFAVTASTFPYEALFSTASIVSGFFHVAISTSGHIISNGPLPSVSSCGTNPSVSGDDNDGTITVGSGVAVTACTLTFASTWGVTPVCLFDADSATIGTGPTSKSATSVTIGFSAGLGGGVVEYHCRCSGKSCV